MNDNALKRAVPFQILSFDIYKNEFLLFNLFKEIAYKRNKGLKYNSENSAISFVFFKLV